MNFSSNFWSEKRKSFQCLVCRSRFFRHFLWKFSFRFIVTVPRKGSSRAFSWKVLKLLINCWSESFFRDNLKLKLSLVRWRLRVLYGNQQLGSLIDTISVNWRCSDHSALKCNAIFYLPHWTFKREALL